LNGVEVSNNITAGDLDDITLAQMADLAQDKILGRATASTGIPEAIGCTAAGRALLDDASATAQIATLGLDADLATFALPANTTISAAGAAILDDATAGDQLTTLGVTAAGKALLDDANAAAQVATLGITATAAELNVLDNIPATLTSTELGYVDGVTSAIQTQMDDKKPATIFSRMATIENDCWWPILAAFAPLYGAPIASGTMAAGYASANQPGVVDFNSAAGANSGYYVGSGADTLLIAGGETFECTFAVGNTGGTTIRLGFHDASTVTEPTDGVWVSIIEDLLTGYAKNNAGPTVAATHYHITAGVAYRAKIVLNADATLATFTLATCADGIQVWTDTVNANIPTGAGRRTALRMIATNSGTSAIQLLILDWYRYNIYRVLVR
jgi:hypothetical protein